MSDSAILTEYDDGVLLVTLNRPHKRNAFDEAQWDGLRDSLNLARGDDSVAVVVLTGAKFFDRTKLIRQTMNL